MHAARALNAQRKRRDEKLQAQQRRLSAVSVRSVSRSPVPSVDVEVGVRHKKSGSKGVDFAYVGFIIAIFGAVPLLVGTFVNVPALWEIGLGLTIIGLLIGIVFWCCDFCVQQAANSLEEDSGRRRSRSRRPIGGRVEDISSLKPVASSFKNDRVSPSTRSNSLANAQLKANAPEVVVDTISEIENSKSPVSKVESSNSRNGFSSNSNANSNILLVNPNPNSPQPQQHLYSSGSSGLSPIQTQPLSEAFNIIHKESRHQNLKAIAPLEIIEIEDDPRVNPIKRMPQRLHLTDKEIGDETSPEKIDTEENVEKVPNSPEALEDVQKPTENQSPTNTEEVEADNNEMGDEVPPKENSENQSPTDLNEDEFQNPTEINQLEENSKEEDSESTSNMNIDEVIAEIESATDDTTSKTSNANTNENPDIKKEEDKVLDSSEENPKDTETDSNSGDKTLNPEPDDKIPTTKDDKPETPPEIQFSI